MLSALVLLSCSAEDQPAPPEPIDVNKAPSQPQLRAPENDLFCTTNIQVFEWILATDPEEDEITYTLQISTDENFNSLFFTDETNNISNSVDLEKGKTYYWRVLAEDANGNKSPFSDRRRLYTEGEATSNYLPSAPQIVSPVEAATVSTSSVALKWSAEDADGDKLRYDVYFGKTEQPDLVAENLETATHDVNLEPGSTYYWKVVVKDVHEGKTTGKTWSFKTE